MRNKDKYEIICKSDNEYTEAEFIRECEEHNIQIVNVAFSSDFKTVEETQKKRRNDILFNKKPTIKFQEILPLNFKTFLIIFLAGFVNAFGVGCLLMPGLLIDGSMSGTAIVINKVLPQVSMSTLLVVMNLPFFIFAAKKLNRNYLIYSIYAVICYSFAMYVEVTVLKLDVIIIKALSQIQTDLFKDDYVMFLCAMFGGIFSGLGSGIIIRQGGTLDGIEVTAVMLSKKIGFSVGQIIMAYNIILLFVAAFIFNLTSALMSIFAYVIASKVIDGVVEGLDKAKAAMIISDNGLEIAKALNEKLGRGVTIINGNGYFQNNNKKIVYYVVNRFEIAMMKDIVLSVDKNAFIAINEVTDVLGQSIKK